MLQCFNVVLVPIDMQESLLAMQNSRGEKYVRGHFKDSQHYTVSLEKDVPECWSSKVSAQALNITDSETRM